MTQQNSPLLLAVAISCALGPAEFARAGAFYPEAVKTLDAINWDSGHSFIDDATFDLKFRAVGYVRDYYQRGTPNSPGKQIYSDGTKRNAGLAIWADYQSGWLWNTVGVDLGLVGSQRIEHAGNRDIPNLWASGNMDGQGKLAVANVKFQLGDDETGLSGRAGRMTYDSPLVRSDMDYAVPETFQGISLNGHWNWVEGYYARFDKHSNYNSSSMDKKWCANRRRI